jgi:hypothetical protein
MAVITILPFFGIFVKRLAHSLKYATFMASWSASTLLWVLWLMERISTFEYFLCLCITCSFHVLWFYRTKLR